MQGSGTNEMVGLSEHNSVVNKYLQNILKQLDTNSKNVTTIEMVTLYK